MKKTLMDTTMELTRGGQVPSVSDVAEAAEVSRATAYRYFPTQAALIQEAVDEALGPILRWASDSPDAEERITDLLAFAYPRMENQEATLRGALWLALDQWKRKQAGTFGDEAPMVRGNRVRLLREAVAPLDDTLDEAAIDKLTQSLSLLFGTEALVVLKDIWGLDGDQARQVALWASHALVRTAIAEAQAAADVENGAEVETGRQRQAAPRPQKRRVRSKQ
jgi:AcrR family transcriptional regulator